MLGFDVWRFLFTIGNFLLLFFLLKKFLFKPILAILEDRKAKIQEGLSQIEAVKKERELAIAEKDKLIAEARLEFQEIIRQGEKQKKEIIAKGQEEGDRIIKNAKECLEKEREELKREMYGLLIDMVSSASDKALFNISKQKEQGKMIENVVLQSLQEHSLGGGVSSRLN